MTDAVPIAEGSYEWYQREVKRLGGELAAAELNRDMARAGAEGLRRELKAALQRAEQAEDLLRIAHDTSNRSEAERARAVQRAEQAEAERDAASLIVAELQALRDSLYANLDQAQQRAEQAEAERDAMAALMERMPDTHARFSVVGSDEPPECADWCGACRLERAAATIERMQAVYRSRFLNAQTGTETPVEFIRNLGAELAATLDAPSGTDSHQECAAEVPDSIDYDQDGELDDVVVNDCKAHLERLDTGRWFLGFYGSDGRALTIDIASKTGRAEVRAFVTHNEGIEETR